MSDIAPAFAVVRPRATRAGSLDPRPIEDVVAELADQRPHGAVPLVGPPGSGKSTALAHLAAAFGDDKRLIFLDEPSVEEIERHLAEANAHPDALLIFSAPPTKARRAYEISLAPWGFDELIEYLLAEHRHACGSVIQRLGPAARRLWSPRLATIVLDVRLRQAVRVYCLTLLLKGAVPLEDVFLQQVHAECGDVVRPLLRHPTVQLPLAADRVAWTLSTGSTVELKQPLPADLVEAVAARCGNDTNAVIHLRKLLRSGPEDNKHAMAASILLAVDPTWTPHSRPYGVWKLRGGYFSGARWPRVNLAGAALDRADFSDAHLNAAIAMRRTPSFDPPPAPTA
jgi:energy-coupling factor transporter ATP-binding protein EcfA2